MERLLKYPSLRPSEGSEYSIEGAIRHTRLEAPMVGQVGWIAHR